MRYTVRFALLAAVTLSGCTKSTPQQQVINDAARALGGAGRILAAKTLVIEGEGVNNNLGQDMRPETNSQTFTVTGYKRAMDLQTERARTEQTRTPTFPFYQGQAPQKQIAGLDGGIGYNVGANGNATRVPEQTAKDRRVEFYHHPLTSLRAALDSGAKLNRLRDSDGETALQVTSPKGVVFTLAIDGTTKLPTRVISQTHIPNLGDVNIETRFTEYEDVEGLKLPARFVMRADRFLTAKLHVTKQSINSDVGDLAAPAAVAAAAPSTGPSPTSVTVEEIAKGVWCLTGASASSVVVEFSDHLLLIEAPQNDARTLAVIAKARELRPNKPLTKVLNTHHHFDHSGGIRAAVSEGLEVITHTYNSSFYLQVVERPHTIVPDALAKNPKRMKIDVVDEEMILKDATRTVNLYHVAGSSHADTLLMAYLPKERLLIEADAYNPGSPVTHWAPNLLENVKKRNLRIDRIVPLHGKIVPFNELVKTVQATLSN